MNLFRTKTIEQSIADTEESEHQLRKQLEHWPQLGLSQVKIKVGEDWGRRPRRDLDRAAYTRDTVGDAAQALVARTRAAGPDLAVCVGLGVSNGQQAAEVASFADGCRVTLVDEGARMRGEYPYTHVAVFSRHPEYAALACEVGRLICEPGPARVSLFRGRVSQLAWDAGRKSAMEGDDRRLDRGRP